MIVIGCNLSEWGTFLRRMDNFVLKVPPQNIVAMFEAITEFGDA
jgi:uroporphyrinogen decarboxylase